MKNILVAGVVALFMASTANALTLKSGQVLGSDGGVYDGASPEKQQALIAQAQNGGEIAGVTGAIKACCFSGLAPS